MAELSSLPTSIATNESAVHVLPSIKRFTSIEIQDEKQIYTDLSLRLIDIEREQLSNSNFR